MASRKVLINYHTSGSSAPAAANVYHGELVVAHETGKETIFTKNNANNMVPFVSCAQTISIIDGKISAAQVDVKKKTGETHLDVTTGSTQPKVFTLETKDVQSEEEFKSYSASTTSALTILTNAFNTLLNNTVTGISGDSIIVATVKNPNSGANTYNLTHKTGKQASGFNKLSTDTYGHVTASTAVAASDIEGLGFKSSAWTEEKILSAITALDSETAVTAGKYITGIAIKDGKISGITQADLPKLASATTGTGNVVTDIAVNDHTITFAKDLTVASDQDLKNLSAVTITGVTAAGVAVPVANHVAKIYSASSSNFGVVKVPAVATSFITNTNGSISVATGTSSSSVARGDQFLAVSGATTANTQNLNNLSAVTLTGVSMNGDNVTVTDHVAVLGNVVTEVVSSGTGNAFTGYSFTDGKLTLSKGSVATSTQGGYADSALQVVCGSTYITTNAKSGSNGKKIQTITAKQQDVETASATGQGLADAYDVKQYVESLVTSSVNYKGATATLPTSSTVGDMYITTAQIAIPSGSSATGAAQTAETGDFIIARSSGKWDVIQKNLDGAVTGSLTANTVTLGNGTHTVKSLANGTAGQVLAMSGTTPTPTWVNAALTDTATTETGHYTPSTSASTKGTTTATTSFIKGIYIDSKNHVIDVATGTVVTAETQISITNNAAVNTASAVVSSVASGGTKGHTLTVSKTNKIFSASTADEAVKTKSALTFTFADGSANVVFDGSANKTVSIPKNTDTATTEEGHYTPSTSASTKGTTAATTTDFIKGIRIDSKNHVIDVVTGTVVTAETKLSYASGASVSNNAAAVMTGLTVNNHAITYGKTNKIFSAQTANSAVCATTAESAATAASAAKVAKALSISGYSSETAATKDTAFSYDGSAARSLSFGTVGNAGLNSMSTTSAGLVDVEVIDCGTY